MLKIVVVSDDHNNIDILNKIALNNKDADYFYHLGDSEAERASDIEPFVSIRGNNDYGLVFPNNRLFHLNNRTIYMEHGHHIYYGDYHTVLERAKEKGADIILFGHSHRYLCIEKDGILILNPGSCNFNRDYSRPSYAVLYLDESGAYKVEKRLVDE